MNELEQSVHVVVSEAPIDPVRLLALVSRPDSGATVLFLGTVRDHSSGKSGVTHLDYEVYSELVESKIVEVVAEASNRWPVLAVAVEHRTVQTIKVTVPKAKKTVLNQRFSVPRY
jgi:molybdopterin synthase catalytic subunit